ncbi:MAG: hypothetical protein H0V83_02090 [Rubrobacter sp.]|nr:hypothetical protein [Rubrobacter sp.]
MKYYSGLAPQECMHAAEVFLLERGASIKGRTPESVTFTRLVPPSFDEWVAMCITNLVVPGLGTIWAIARIVLIFMYPAEARIIARQVEGRTLVSIDGRRGNLCGDLEVWAKMDRARKSAVRNLEMKKPQE